MKNPLAVIFLIVSRLLLKEKPSLKKTPIDFLLRCYPESQMYVTHTELRVSEKCKSIRAIGIPVLKLANYEKKTLNALAVARKMQRRWG